jgi:hypothetical protein
VTDDLVTFLRARVDDDEAAAKEPLCINCKIPIVPLRNAFGITGYTHDSWDGGEHGWQGQHCPGAPTGAEAVQNPARVLAEVDAKRRLVKLHEPVVLRGGAGAQYFETTTVCRSCEPPRQFPENAFPCPTLRVLALPYAEHPDFREEWKP